MSDQERLTDLEVKFAYLEQTIESLNEVVTRQWAEIDRLKKLNERLDSRIFELEGRTGQATPHERPPHY